MSLSAGFPVSGLYGGRYLALLNLPWLKVLHAKNFQVCCRQEHGSSLTVATATIRLTRFAYLEFRYSSTVAVSLALLLPPYSIFVPNVSESLAKCANISLISSPSAKRGLPRRWTG